MAQKSKAKGSAITRRRQLWGDAGINNIFAWLSAKFPDSQWYIKGGTHIVGKCPLPSHDDSTASFMVTPGKGIAKCFGCNACFVDLLTFIRRLTGDTFSNAASVLRKQFGLKSAVPDSVFEKLQAKDAEQDKLQRLTDFLCQTMKDAVEAYPNFDTRPELHFAKPTIEELMKRNLGGYAPNELRPASAEDNKASVADPHGVIPVLTANQLLGIVPPLALFNAHFQNDPEMLTWIRRYLGTVLESGGKFIGWYVLPYHDEPGSVARLKLRAFVRDNKDFIFVDGNNETEKTGHRGWYGFHYFRTWLGPSSNGASGLDSIYLLEGEFDVLVCIAQQLRGGYDDSIFLAMGGSSMASPDPLVDFGIKNIYIVQDDDKGGDNNVENVIRATKTEKLSYYIFRWPSEYREHRDPTNPDVKIKDPDDAIQQLGYPKFRKYILRTEGEDSAYNTALDWVFDKANRELSRLPAGDVKQKGNEAIEWGRLLLDKQECYKFTESIAAHHDLSAQALQRGIFEKNAKEEVFVERLLDVLKMRMHFVGTKTSETGKRMIVFYDKGRRVIDAMPLNDLRALEATFSAYFGTLYDFVRDEVGDPPFMSATVDGEGAAEGEERSGFALQPRTRKYCEYMNFAIQKTAKDLPNLDHTPMKAQGYHYIEEVDGEHRAYLVNGQDVFYITHKNNVMKADLLDGPSHGGFLFKTRGQTWLKTLTRADDITSNHTSPVEMFKMLRGMTHHGWGWKHDGDPAKNLDVDAIFLACYAMCIPVMNAFSRQVAIILNAEKQSGKSRFLGGFIGGREFPGIHVCAHTVVMNGYTEASVRQQRDGSTLCLCLEEFEDEGGQERRSVVVRRILELTRDLISESPVEWSVGTTTGEERKYSLRFPMVCSAIHPLRDGASLSRFIPFNLIHTPNREDPVHVLEAKFGLKAISELRHNLGVAMYRYVPRLRQIQEEIKDEFATGELLPSYVPARFREALYPILTMLKFLAEQADAGVHVPNYRQFAIEFSTSRRDHLTQLHTTAVNEQIFESILSSPFDIKGKDNLSSQTTIRSMLTDLNSIGDINKTFQGVFYDARQRWLVVSWVQACQGVLSNTRYRTEQVTYLRQVSERSPYFISTETARQHTLLERMANLMGPGYSYDQISVFSVAGLIKQVEAMWAGETPNAADPVAPSEPPETVGNSSPTHIDDMNV